MVNSEDELKRIDSTNKGYEVRLGQINNKLIQVRAYIGDLNDQNKILKEKLRKYESENNNLNEDIEENETKIDRMEEKFQQKHE